MTIALIVIIALVVLAALTVAATLRGRDAASATGRLERETLSRDRGTVTITETDVINAGVVRYLDTTGPGARATDCLARPGQGVWLVVTCTGAAGRFDYAVDRFGRRVTAPSGAAPAAPET